ncbi:E3 ubiquitin-protein ligase RNF34-like [Diadema antillarum]|uniref:E3 ubiquitin-protein ligase RNF34-like n=1 Tax=Diadema antillarum TaxID=105358 RepID=UPI003A8C62D0
MGSGAGKPVVSPAATPVYTFCYTSSPEPPSRNGSARPEGRAAAGGGVNQAGASGTGGESGHWVGSSGGAGGNRRPSSRQNYYGEAVDENDNMVCEACSASFNLFKRKYRCMDCDRYYCADCYIKSPRKCCRTCSEIALHPSRAELMNLKVKDLRLYLKSHSVSTQACTEKDDLVDLIVEYVEAHPSAFNRPAGSGSSRTSFSSNRSSTSHPQSSTSSQQQHQPPPQQQQPSAGQRATQRLEEVFNDLFRGLSNAQSESSVDPPNFRAETIYRAATTPSGNFNTHTAFNSTASSSGTSQRPQSRQAWQTQPPPDLTPTTEASTSATTSDDVHTHTETAPSQAQRAEQTPVQPIRRRASLSDIETAEGIDSLSNKQLKEILTKNFVDFKGCVERWELQERVRRLYNEKQERKKRVEEKAKDAEGKGQGVLDEDDSSLCKICMDAEIDCVLLECGHMVTCTTCGKQMNECPICRQYVIRAVHIFRA